MPNTDPNRSNGYIKSCPPATKPIKFLPTFEELREQSKDIEGTIKAKRLNIDEAIYKRRTRPKNEKSFKATYGITIYEYEEMFYSQGGKCAICRTEPDEGKILATDHCHKSGKVRGLLCIKCNAGLGMFGDNIPCMIEALEYLRK